MQVVQSAGPTAEQSTPLSLSLGADPTAGNKVVALVARQNAAAIAAPDGWALGLGVQDTNIAHAVLYLDVAPGEEAAARTLNYSGGPANSQILWLGEVQGLAAGPPQNLGGKTDGAGGYSGSTGSVNTTTNSGWAIGMVGGPATIGAPDASGSYPTNGYSRLAVGSRAIALHKVLDGTVGATSSTDAWTNWVYPIGSLTVWAAEDVTPPPPTLNGLGLWRCGDGGALQGPYYLQAL